jgi:hypothetical protein
MKITFYQEFGTFNTSFYGSIQGAQCLTILYTISTLQPSHSNKQGSWTLLVWLVIIFHHVNCMQIPIIKNNLGPNCYRLLLHQSMESIGHLFMETHEWKHTKVEPL